MYLNGSGALNTFLPPISRVSYNQNQNSVHEKSKSDLENTIWSKLGFRRQMSKTQQPAPINLKIRDTLTDRLNFKNKQLQYVTCMSPLYNILTYIILIYFMLNYTWSKKTWSKCKLNHLNSTCNCNLIYSIIYMRLFHAFRNHHNSSSCQKAEILLLSFCSPFTLHLLSIQILH